MGRIDRVEYECDWCHARSGAERWPGGDLGAPSKWRYLDSLGFDDDLCEDCASAAKTLLDGAKAARVAGVSVPVRSEEQEKK